MTVNVETLEKLERKITLTLPAAAIQNEVSKRLRRLARDIKMDGFRPGKVPMNVVAQRYGYSVHYEVMNDQVSEAFSAAVKEAQLRVAGAPKITENDQAPEGHMAFDAVFEIYPDVKINDLSNAEVEKVITQVDEAAIDRTVDILRKQRRTFLFRPDYQYAETGDRVTIDFVGNIDGEPFEGGKAEGFQFILGDGQMLSEFENALPGMKPGESKTFPLAFPENYHGQDVAGKTADFMVTVKTIEYPVLPDVDGAFAASLGIENATVDGLRAEIRANLEREVNARALIRNKRSAMETLLAHAELDLPQAIVQADLEQLIEKTRADLKSRGVQDAETTEIPKELFMAQAERRVRLGLVIGELVSSNALHPTPDQIMAYLKTLSASYEKPEDVIRWYTTDKRRMEEVEAAVIENNVTDFVLSRAKMIDKWIGFEELMTQAA